MKKGNAICLVFKKKKTVNANKLLYFRIALAKKNFTLKYDTNIPRQVVSDITTYLIQYTVISMIYKL